MPKWTLVYMNNGSSHQCWCIAVRKNGSLCCIRLCLDKSTRKCSVVSDSTGQHLRLLFSYALPFYSTKLAGFWAYAYSAKKSRLEQSNLRERWEIHTHERTFRRHARVFRLLRMHVYFARSLKPMIQSSTFVSQQMLLRNKCWTRVRLVETLLLLVEYSFNFSWSPNCHFGADMISCSRKIQDVTRIKRSIRRLALLQKFGFIKRVDNISTVKYLESWRFER